MKCKFCGCTDSRACRGGCSWTRPEVCSQCADAAIAAYAPLDVRYTLDDNNENEYERFGKTGFLPVPGMYVDCGEGNLRKVEEVYFWPQERRVEVYFGACEEGWTRKAMLKMGWSLP